MSIVLFLIGALLSADGLYCGFTGSMGIGEAIITAAGIFFILWGTFHNAFKEKKFLRILKGFFVGYMILLVVYSAAVCVMGSLDNATGREDYAIVPGAGLIGNEPSSVLAERLDKTVEFFSGNPDAEVIVSGGRDKGAFISEAEAMSIYLSARGVEQSAILREENATSTYENFMYSAETVEDGNTVIITSNFHVFRSVQMARLCGIDATYIGAPTPLFQLPVCCAREMLAEIASLRHYVY